MPGHPLGLIGEDRGQRLMGASAFGEGRRLERRGADKRVTEGDQARAFVGPHQLVTLGRSEVVELVHAAARRLQHPDVPGALKRRDEEERPGRGREPCHPGREQLLQTLTERQH